MNGSANEAGMRLNWGWLLLPPVALSFLTLIASQSIFVVGSFRRDLGMGQVGRSLEWFNYLQLFADDYYLETLGLSLRVSLTATLLTIVLAFPAAGSVNGTLVLAEGDVNLTFKRYIERAITLTIENDHVTRIDGHGVDAELLRSHYAAWNEKEAYAVSHVGYGLNDAARWDSMALYDKRDFNGTELRAFAGNFLYSTGANEVAGRHTRGHFDFPLRGCTVALDGAVVIEAGRVTA